MEELDLTLSVEEVLPWIKVRPVSADNELKQQLESAIDEVFKFATVSFAYNLEVDLDFFEFKLYQPPFPLKRLSVACATLGEDLDSLFDFYSKKGRESFRYLVEASSNALIEKVVDYVNFLICKSKQDGEKQSFRKSPGIGRVPIAENKTIVDYLNCRKIKVDVNDNYSLIPKKTVVFMVEWADKFVDYHEFKKRCNHCGQSPCIYRI